MSADNGIYVLPLSDGYYVAHCQAIDNLCYLDSEEYDPRTVVSYFGGARSFATHDEALKHAVEMADDYTILEYGVSTLHAQPLSMSEFRIMAEEDKKNSTEYEEVAELPSGCCLYRKPNGVGGHTYSSDEVGGGVFVWDTSLVDEITLLTAILDQRKLAYIESVKKNNA